MTLSEMLIHIQRANVEPPEGTEFRAQNSVTIHFKGLLRYREGIRELAQVPAIRPRLTKILDSNLYRSDMDDMTIDQSVGLQLLSAAREIHILRQGLRAVLESLTPEARDNCIKVKLPNSADYKGVVSDQQALLLALEQLLFIKTEFNSPITIEGWETGSLWLVLCVGVPLAVEVIGRAVFAGAVIRKKIHEGTIAMEQARKLEVENDYLEHLSAKAKIAVDAVVDTEALAIYDAYFKEEAPNDKLERIKKTIRTLGEMIDRGAEVYPALLQPENSNNLFPDFKHLDTVTSAIKQLAAGDDQTNATG